MTRFTRFLLLSGTALAAFASSTAADQISEEALAVFQELRGTYNLDRYQDDPDGAAVGWGAGPALKTYLAAYEATGDIEYLHRIAKNADRIFANRSDRLGLNDQIRGRPMPAWVTGKYTNDRPHAWLVHASNFLFPVARWIYLVKQDPELEQTFGDQAENYLSDCIETMGTFAELDWREGPADGEGRFVGDPGSNGGDLPHNMMHAAGRVYVQLWLITGEERFRDKAEKMAYFLKNRLTLRGDRYEWRYSTTNTRTEDVSHGALSVDFAVQAWRAGIVFETEDLNRFAQTFRHIVSIGEPDNDFPGIRDSFETYTTGTVNGQAKWIASVPAQANVEEDVTEATDGSKFLRITVDKDAGEAGVRVRNPEMRDFTADGIVRWSIKNNSTIHKGDLNLRLSVNGGTNNIFNFRYRAESDSLTHSGVTTQTWADKALPRDTWTDWTVEFFTSDPANRHFNLYVTRSDDGAPLFEIRDIAIGDFSVNTLYAFDLNVPTPVENLDYSIDNIRTYPVPPESSGDRVLGWRWYVNGSGSLERSYLAHRWLRLAWVDPDLRPLYFDYFSRVARQDPPLQMLQAAAYLAETGIESRFEQPLPEPGSYRAWAAQHFSTAEQEDAEVSGPQADPSGSGIPNLLRYALGLNPHEAGRDRLPAILPEPDAASIVLQVKRDATATEAKLSIESSAELTTWAPIESHLEPVSKERNGDIETLTFRDTRPATRARFYQVRMTQE